MKLYFIGLCDGVITPYHSTSIEVAQCKAQAIADKNNETVVIYEPCLNIHPSSSSIAHAKKHLNDIIEEPSRTLHPNGIRIGSMEEIVWNNSNRSTEPKLYDEILRQNEFLSHFDNAEELYNTSKFFRLATEKFAKGATVYDIIASLIGSGKPINEMKP